MKKFAALFLAVVIAVTMLAAPAASSAAGTPQYDLGASAQPDHITLTWTQDPLTTQTITWRTNITIARGLVQYAKAADKASFPGKAATVEATVQKFTSDLGDMNIHTATLTGLEPGTEYIYRVGDGTNWSDIHTFTTEASNTHSFKFLIFGDSQSGDPLNPEYKPWHDTIQNAFKTNTDAKFFVNVGDLVEQGQNYVHWNKWFEAAKGVIDTIPAMATQGNHETYNPPDGHSTKPIFWTTQFKLPQNGPEGLKGQAYSFDYGNAHIVMLDSQEEEEKGVAGDILAAQKAWLEKDLQNTNKPWKLVFFHKTPYYNKATRTNEDIKAAFQPLFDKYHVDVVFNGHDHAVARTYPIAGDKFVSSPAKGTIYYLTGRSGNKYYPDLSAKVWDAFFYDPQDQPNYIVAELNGDKLTLRAMKQDGTPIDTYTIDKASGLDTPQTIVPPKYNSTRLVIFGNMLQQPLLPVTPKQVNGQWYIPVRAFMQFLGGNVAWYDDGSVTIVYGKDKVQMASKSARATINGQEVNLPGSSLMDKNTLFIPAADLEEFFGFSYKYDAATNMLMFTK
ncbi:fibronectin type III domain-containing protein [Neomoorella thermoacetica]|uniref:Metallophosphoesterase n=1 Tax=Moorella thermoacetica (strain ATCC 39073 / JCM 9320) TaxID=264732 RepID=Q2RJB5_MOOTA|nr:fibronectin type III domain-containing protein [Moorella thermoacetica]AKX93927.1 alkaline phosphatase precursor [Moorella thermoacetica]AKX96568.1 alkaline phosphatase precursor [Moorella thermoacetica]OIQ56297.1 alkaline phosphatase precursor [Moorella thermoacetica]OIQ57738.1 alkaline phosphatase precursor [Moorella thermoacetica]QDA00382.1 Alkaline phosphatase precursor [Moorella thermoacetica]